MRYSRGVFNTNQVNLSRMMIPASELMRAEEIHHRECLACGHSAGMPSHIQHDMHRLHGWSRSLGLYIDSEMVRVLGVIEQPETDEEKANLEQQASDYWERHHQKCAEPYQKNLADRAMPANTDAASFLRMEAAVLNRSGLAAELYPEFFETGSEHVDKDGLIDYRFLLNRTREIQPGVFHDADRDLLLFVHRFFRRSLSHRNALNSYFLDSFAAVVKDDENLSARLKLDPDLLGHPESARRLIELEYWHGPIYSDDIDLIPSGVAEHKADERTRFYEGVDRTHVWWKRPESRLMNGRQSEYRTFEIEELIENPSGGLKDAMFGCRYAHAEFSSEEQKITHFDGAVRAYEWKPYLERIETLIDRAGKHSIYTKIFRLDGALSVSKWKRLLSDFFRGNNLIPEYLGASVEVDEEEVDSAKISTQSRNETLAALISICPGQILEPMQLCAEQYQELGGENIPYVEIGTGEIAEHLRSKLKLVDVMAVGIRDDVLNLSRLMIGNQNNLKMIFDAEITALGASLQRDAQAGLIQDAAIPLTWEDHGLLVTLSIAGKASEVATVLQQISKIVDPTLPPSKWIEPLSELIKTSTFKRPTGVIWDGVSRGVLKIAREGVVEQEILIPQALKERLVSSGKLDVAGTLKS